MQGPAAIQNALCSSTVYWSLLRDYDLARNNISCMKVWESSSKITWKSNGRMRTSREKQTRWCISFTPPQAGTYVLHVWTLLYVPYVHFKVHHTEAFGFEMNEMKRLCWSWRWAKFCVSWSKLTSLNTTLSSVILTAITSFISSPSLRPRAPVQQRTRRSSAASDLWPSPHGIRALQLPRHAMRLKDHRDPAVSIAVNHRLSRYVRARGQTTSLLSSWGQDSVHLHARGGCVKIKVRIPQKQSRQYDEE